MDWVPPPHVIERVSRGAQAPLLNVVHGSLCASVIAHILRGTTMRSVLGLVVPVVVILIVLKLMGVL